MAGRPGALPAAAPDRHRLLRAYQPLVGAAILASVLNGYGATFTVMMARQLGKNELSAHLEAGLLCRCARPLHRAAGKLSFCVPEQYGHDDFLSALALTSRLSSDPY